MAAPGARWLPFAVAADTIYAVPFTTPMRPTKLAAFRHRGAAIGGSCRMGLYTQRPDGRLGALLAVSDSLLVLEGTSGGLPNLNVVLTPDTHYWVAAACGDAQSVTLVAQESATQTYYTYVNSSQFAYGDPLPASFPSEAEQHTGALVGLFVQLRDVP